MTYKQETRFSCGASAIRNCIEALNGIVPSEKYVRRIAGTTIQGTSEAGIMKALRKLDYYYEDFYTENPNTFKNKLLKVLKSGKVAITIIDSSSHWVAVTGYSNKKIIFVDSDFKKAEQHFTVKEFTMITRNIDKIKKKEYWYLIIMSNLTDEVVKVIQ